MKQPIEQRAEPNNILKIETVEEIADKHLSEAMKGSMGSPMNSFYNGFLAGYNEAMRWRHPIAEKPEIFETVFVKAEKRWEGRSTETFYTTSSRVGGLIFECEGSKKMYDGSYSQVEVIGWRPIETHINK